jgi:hypothetical protein
MDVHDVAEGTLRGVSMTRVLFVCVVLSVLVGCATAKATYTPDGRQGYIIDCSGQGMNWGKCYEKAGALCGNAGYEILAQPTDHSTVWGDAIMMRNLVITCQR